MNHPSRVYVIIGSLRARRVGPTIAAWIAGIGAANPSMAVDVVDLADWPLPMHDEPGIPAMGGYETEFTQAWSAKIAAADGYVMVTPQYNWGYPAALKNALDHLYAEWKDKPAVIVSYGGHGGNKCAAQLRQVLEGGFKMRVAATMPALEMSNEAIRSSEIDPPVDFVAHAAAVENAFAELAALLRESAARARA